ncbi:MAG: hypothetical protein HUU54_05645 [Ignavibacteriaceae bacterium]|nr:hypothetical protein [Ignavibacteriaceae bacterium]
MKELIIFIGIISLTLGVIFVIVGILKVLLVGNKSKKYSRDGNSKSPELNKSKLRKN